MTPSTKRSDDAPSVPKSTLFCPECSFDSPVSGEWTRVTNDSVRELHCPLCGAVVDRRPRQARRTVVEAE